MRRCAFAVPGDLATPTGGYAYDRRVIDELGRAGWQIDVVDLGEGFPFPTVTTRAGARAQLLAIAAGTPVVIDGLALGVLPEIAAELKHRNPLVALVHHPLALETGLAPDAVQAFAQSERAALASADAVLATSPATAALLIRDYGVPERMVTVARPGNDPAPASAGSRDGLVRLLSVGAISRRKGYDVLVEALATLKPLPWQVTIVGDRLRNPAATGELDALVARHDLGARITMTGAIASDELDRHYGRADVFVLASRFEGYGMAYAEAIAHGLPVIGCQAGAIPETVPQQAGLLVPPDDVDALARALRRMIDDEDARRQFAQGAREVAARLPTWQDTAGIVARVLEAVA